jgi:hypothetical protein
VTRPGLPDFSWSQTYQNGKSIQNNHKLYQTALYYTKWSQSIPNDHKNTKHFPFKGPPKYTKIGIFGLKIKHLATLDQTEPILAYWVTVYFGYIFENYRSCPHN